MKSLQTNPMGYHFRNTQTDISSDHYQKLFSNRVITLVRQGALFSEAEAAPLVRKWNQSVQKEHRPTVDGVIWQAKRVLNGLQPIS